LLFYIGCSGKIIFLLINTKSSTGGGGKIGSTTILIQKKKYLKAFYSILGITLPNRGQANYRQGLVLASMSHTLKFSSIIKSNPKISKENSFLFGFILLYTERIASAANFYIKR